MHFPWGVSISDALEVEPGSQAFTSTWERIVKAVKNYNDPGEFTAKRMEHPMAKMGDFEYEGWSVSSSGLTAVWAKDNTREALFDAMRRKEVYATTGPRIMVRFWGGWTDPDFNPAQRAFYYARVIEIPTPRWTAFEAKFFAVKAPEESPMIIQERAYTSPIWYEP